MPRILLLGYFGAGNFGDDALLANWLIQNRQRLEDRGLLVDIICGDQNPLSGFAESEGLETLVGKHIPKREALSVKAADYEFLLAPGGSLLQDTTSVKSLAYYLWLIRKFAAAKRRVFMLNQGVGPLHSWLAYFFTPRILANTTMLSLRDVHSYEWCNSYPALKSHPQLVYATDPIIQAGFSEGELPARLIDRDYSLFIPRPTGDLPSPIDETTEAQALATLLEHCHEVTGLEQVLLPLHPSTDVDFCHGVAAHCEPAPIVLAPGYLGSYPLTTAWTVIRNAKLVVSYRLHGLITAAGSGIPAMGVAYDPKVQAFCNEAALPYCFPATVHETQAIDDLRRLWNDRESVCEVLSEKVATMKTRLDQAQEQFYGLW